MGSEQPVLLIVCTGFELEGANTNTENTIKNLDSINRFKKR